MFCTVKKTLEDVPLCSRAAVSILRSFQVQSHQYNSEFFQTVALTLQENTSAAEKVAVELSATIATTLSPVIGQLTFTRLNITQVNMCSPPSRKWRKSVLAPLV